MIIIRRIDFIEFIIDVRIVFFNVIFELRLDNED